MIVVVTDMIEMGCRKIARKNPDVDIIIGSSRRNRLSLPKVTQHHALLHLDRYGKHIGKFSLFCPWKGGAQITSTQVPGQPNYHNAFVALSRDLPKDNKIAEWMESYIAKIRLMKAQMAISSEGAGNALTPHRVSNGKRYVGMRTCKRCHLSAFLRWKKTGHGHAFQTLVRKGNQYDSDCIGCHSAGYGMKGGFKKISKVKMLAFVNVQCEACHGPGSLHVKSGGDIRKIRRKVPRKVCLTCHTEEHSPDFIYKVYLARLACGGKPSKIKTKISKRKTPFPLN